MFEATFHAIRRNLALFLVVGFVLFLPSLLKAYSVNMGSVWVIVMMLAVFQLFLIKDILYQKIGSDFKFWEILKVILKNLLIVLVPFVITLAGFVLAKRPDFAPMTTTDLMGIIGCLCISWSLVAALVGTWIPAGIYGQNASLSAALRRGRAQVFRRAPMLALATLVVFAISMLPAFALAWGQQSLTDRPQVLLLGVELVAGYIQLLVPAFWTVFITQDYMAAEQLAISDKLASVF